MDLLNSSFTSILADVTIFTSEEAVGIVYRLGLIMFCLCMIFTALRKVENGDMSTLVCCTDDDFSTAMLIAQTCLQYSLLMFNNLPRQDDYKSFDGGDSKRKLFAALPAEFTRKQSVELGDKFKLAIRTVDDILKAALGKSLSKLKPGTYCKIYVLQFANLAGFKNTSLYSH